LNIIFILELSVGMTTEGIEVRSVGNTKVSLFKVTIIYTYYQDSLVSSHLNKY